MCSPVNVFLSVHRHIRKLPINARKTGTSGGLGSVVLNTILDQNLLSVNEFRISSSNKRNISTKATNAGLEVCYGNMSEPESLVESFAGAEAVFLVSYPSIGKERYELHKSAIDAAR